MEYDISELSIIKFSILEQKKNLEQRNIKNWQSRYTGNIAHETQNEENQNTKATHESTKMSNTDPKQKPEWSQVLEKGKQFLPLINKS